MHIPTNSQLSRTDRLPKESLNPCAPATIPFLSPTTNGATIPNKTSKYQDVNTTASNLLAICHNNNKILRLTSAPQNEANFAWKVIESLKIHTLHYYFNTQHSFKLFKFNFEHPNTV